MNMKLDEFLASAQIERVTLQHWFEMEWIVAPQATPEEISEIDAARAMFIHELRRDFGVNEEGIDIVLHLVDQLHGMRRVLAALHADLRALDEAPLATGQKPPR